MKRGVILATAAVLSLGHSADAAPENFRIAVNLSNSDNVAYFFTPYIEAMEAGLRAEAPDATITVTIGNNRYDKAEAGAIHDRHTAAGYDLYVSGSGSTSALVADQVAAAGKPHLMIAFEPDIVAQGPGRLRVLPSYASEAGIVVAEARRLGARRVAGLQVHTGGLDAQYSAHLVPAFAATGIDFVTEAFDWNGTDYDAALQRLIAHKPELILISAYHEPHLQPLLDALDRQVPKDIPVLLTVHAVDLLYNGSDRNRLRPYRFVCPVFETRTSAWSRQWALSHGGTRPFYSAAYGYDAGRLIGRALKAGHVRIDGFQAADGFDGETGRIELDAAGDLKGTLGICRLNAALEPELVD